MFLRQSGIDFRYSVSPRWAMPTMGELALFCHNRIARKLGPNDATAQNLLSRSGLGRNECIFYKMEVLNVFILFAVTLVLSD